jgi:ribonuclease HI
MKEEPEAWIYADGACSGNPGPGGWGAILHKNARETRRASGKNLTSRLPGIQ